MYLKATSSPKYDATVYMVQLKLDYIRNKVHGSWPFLKADGLFGPQTKAAVKGFQIYRNITPVSGEIGDTTMKYLDEEYKRMPMLKDCYHPITANNLITALTDNVGAYDCIHFIADIVAQFFSVFDNASKIAEKQANLAKRLQKGVIFRGDIQNLIDKTFNGNPQLEAIRKKIKLLWSKEDSFNDLLKQPNGNTNAWNYAKGKHKIKELSYISKAQQQLAKEKSVIEYITHELKQSFERYIEKINSANFAQKITKAIEERAPKFVKGKKIGGRVLSAASLLPVITDLVALSYNAWTGKSTERIKEQLLDDLISLVEGTLIYIIVAFIVTAAGLTGGVAIIVVVVICLIIGILISLFCPDGSLLKVFLKWIASEIQKVVDNPVYQQSVRTSFI